MKNEGLSIFQIDATFFTLTARRKGCDLIPRIGVLSEIGLCVSCVDKRKCAKYARYLGPHLYAGDETRCSTCIRKATQQGGATTYKSLGGAVIEKIISEHDENGADLQKYIDAHDDEIRSVISDALKEVM